MAREFDVAVFGASGFTGAWIAVAAARMLAASGGTLALAGRDAARLAAVVDRVRREAPEYAGRPVGVVTADVGDAASLLALARRSKVVIGAAGPFRFLGEPLVRACVEGGADMVDITGEPEYMERMELAVGDAAKAAGVLVVNSCGFDSVPADLGALFAAATLRAGGGLPVAIDSFLSLRSGGLGVAAHYATFASAVHGFGSVRDLARVRQAYAAAHPGTARLPSLGPRTPRHDGLWWEPRTDAWAYPFPGADASVVRRTQRSGLDCGALVAPDAAAAAVAGGAPAAGPGGPQLPVSYSAYFTLASTWGAGLFLGYGIVFATLARWGWGRRLLLAWPGLFSHGVFSHEGPTRQQIAGTSFAMTFFVQGAWGVGCVPVGCV